VQTCLAELELAHAATSKKVLADERDDDVALTTDRPPVSRGVHDLRADLGELRSADVVRLEVDAQKKLIRAPARQRQHGQDPRKPQRPHELRLAGGRGALH